MPIETFPKNCREVMRLKHLSYRTEQTYLPVIRRFIEFHGGRTHPRDMGAAEIRAYLSHLAVERNVAASTQNVAFSALLFLYRDVLHIDLPAIGQVERAQRPARLPDLPGVQARHRSTLWGHPTPPPGRGCAAAGGPRGHPAGGHCEEGVLPHVPPSPTS
jgi:hypothetical protein